MKIELTIEEINFILQVLGDLPTKTGAFTIMAKIKQQGDEQAQEPKSEV